ncbi:MAG: ABC transporter ATP-binding protein [Lachnospiraceae bacterium]|jgi:ABC-2 type transport system ATP-binding protein|nr:ABC transporter ATP-binding protein [Lachnospiraceae bacterium]MCI8994735.1 ABC transporter ATP-binding protein [Lachnospiraceae bacterium]MCI9133658.1 ABC transporter ATP-binding protein [Lachnospiraceae bacterium]
METLMECHQLSKHYGTKIALDHVDLTIERGRIIGLLGPNGSGKTTLIKLINGLLSPTQGTLLINGQAPGPETKKVVSYLPERTYFSNWMKVTDIIRFFGDFYADFDDKRAMEMLHRLNINENSRLGTMSKGTKEKVQLIMVMSRNADLYCLDEPIGGVDPAARDYILQTIITNYSENATVLISTHLISDIENVLDDAIFIQSGRVMLTGSVDDIRMQEGKSVDALFREVFRC